MVQNKVAHFLWLTMYKAYQIYLLTNKNKAPVCV